MTGAILVTGGLGYIGSHTCVALAEAGHRLVVVDNLSNAKPAVLERIRARHPKYFNEIYINAPLEVCEQRDTKGLYRRARAGDLKDFIGVSAPYEPPITPELEIRSGEKTVEACLNDLLAFVEERLALK